MLPCLKFTVRLFFISAKQLTLDPWLFLKYQDRVLLTFQRIALSVTCDRIGIEETLK